MAHTEDDPSIAFGLQWFAAEIAFRKACLECDRADGLPVMQVERLSKRADAVFTLWMDTPAITIKGLAFKLRGWRYNANPDIIGDTHTDPDEKAGLAALADAERLCGLAPTPSCGALDTPQLAERAVAEFAEGVS